MRQHLSFVLPLLIVLAACGTSDGTQGDTPPGRDTTAPVTRFTALPGDLVSSAEATFGFEANEPARFLCALDTGPSVLCSSPYTLTDLAEGPRSFVVRAIDEAGNVEDPPRSHAFTVDRTPPVTTLEEAPAGISNATSARFAFAASEAARFECALDEAAFAACTSPLVVEGLGEGQHTFRVRAIDLAGNVETPSRTHGFTVDRSAPTTTLEEAPLQLSNAGSARFVFTANEGARFECALDDAVFMACSSPHVLEEVAEGAHVFQVRAIDEAGNVEEPARTHAFQIDRTAPVTTLEEAPAGLSNVFDARFVFSANEDARFECALDEAAFTACDSPWVVSDVTEGAHAFHVRAIDPAGNVEAHGRTHDFAIDRTAPVTTLDGPEDSTGARASFVFTADEAARFECALDDAAFAPCSSPHVVDQLARGEHVLVVRAIDAAGNVELDPATHVWTVELGTERIRIVAANLSSGNMQSYDPGHGARIMKGLAADVVLIQEFNVGNNSAASVRAFVDDTFGPDFHYVRETGAQIPNGVISRYPVLASGVWPDANVSNRSFVWARLDVPGTSELFVVSVHLLTSSSSNRNAEAMQIRDRIQTNAPVGDYVVIGGDFNTDTRSEACYTTLSSVVSTTGPWPADRNGNSNTNAGRNKPYDNILVSADLRPFEVPVVIGSSTFPNGLVADTRVYQPISELAPALASDSGATNMQHMAVVRDFELP